MPSTISDALIVIPARMDSKRLMGKPMIEIAGRPLVYHTYIRAKAAGIKTLVATPDREIGRFCHCHGIPWRPTRDDHPSGTHRCAEIVGQMKTDHPIRTVINWQIDEPLVPCKHVFRLLEVCRSGRIATLVSECSAEERLNPDLVKVAVGIRDRCRWFSRTALGGAVAHCGVYAFPTEQLIRLGGIPPTELSQAERLEQLTWLEHDYEIVAVRMSDLPLSIDTREDLDAFRKVRRAFHED